MLPQITSQHDRTKNFAWYSVVVDLGNAFGALLGAAPAFFRHSFHLHDLSSYRAAWIFYGMLCLAAGFMIFKISDQVELKNSRPQKKLSPASKPVVMKFAALSGLDSFGGGFLSTALLSYWFFKKFGVDEAFLGPLFFFARLANSFSHLAAAWLAKKIGLVNTMVFTHLPSSILLLTVPFAPNLSIAVILFLIRESLVEMDLPTRQSYIVAVVKEEERTLAAGMANSTRSIAWAASSMTAAPVIKALSFSAPIYLGSFLKIAYDILLYRAFRHLKPPEEQKL